MRYLGGDDLQREGREPREIISEVLETHMSEHTSSHSLFFCLFVFGEGDLFVLILSRVLSMIKFPHSELGVPMECAGLL